MPRKSRPHRGEGTVYQRTSDGLWVGMLDLGLAGGKRRRKTVYGQSENEVLQKLSKLERPATAAWICSRHPGRWGSG